MEDSVMLEEAIVLYSRMAEENFDAAAEAILQERNKYANECFQWANEYKQLAEWLKELKLDREKWIKNEYEAISNATCADALLKMWEEGIITVDEHNKIMDRLNARVR